MGNNKREWTTGEDAILVKTMKEATNRPAGYRQAAKLLGRTPSACTNRYAKERYKVVSDTVEKNTPTIQKSPNIKLKQLLKGRINDIDILIKDRVAGEYATTDKHAFMFYSTIINDIQILVDKIK